MREKCAGCGAKIQTTNPEKIGYIKKEVYERSQGEFYCERCYKLIHYNQSTKVEISESEFIENIKKINNKDVLIVNVVDIFDLEGTLVENIRSYFPTQDILIVANKFDLFLDSVKVSRIKAYLEDYLKKLNINQKATIIVSSFNKQDIRRLVNEIERLQAGSDVYMFGYTNVGKSSLINAILSFIKERKQKITVSSAPSTTLDFIEIPLLNNTKLYDMPGIVNPKQLSYYLERTNLNLILPKKQVKPKIYQLNPGQTLFLGGVAKINFIEGKRSSFIVYASNNLVIHRTKYENAKSFYDKHKDDILKIPSPSERELLGNFKEYNFKVTEAEKIDITISGLGFVTIVGNAEITLEAFEKIKVGERKAII